MENESELCAGQIIVNAKRVYYLPYDTSLPALRFHADQQKFVALDDRKKEDFALCTTLRDMAQRSPQKITTHYYSKYSRKKLTRGRAHGRVSANTVSIDESIPCEALYGVLPINDVTSVLLYVTEKVLVEEIAAGTVSAFTGHHRIYAVRKLEWMRLPSTVPAGSDDDDDEMDAEDVDDEGKESSSESKVEGDDKDSDSSSSSSSSSEEKERDVNNSNNQSNEKTEQTIDEYLDVVDRFCKRVEEENNNYFIPNYLSQPLSQKSCDGSGARRAKDAYTAGGSFLFYSPTLNLALPSSSLIRQAMVTDGAAKVATAPNTDTEQHRSSDAGIDKEEPICLPNVELDEKYNDLFNWNRHLVAPNFVVPTKKDLLEKLQSQGKGEAEAVVAHFTQRTCTFSDAENTLLFVPSFVRGYVGGIPVSVDVDAAPAGKRNVTMLFLSRLSRRWSGTRYNRRGLEPNTSGVVANMCITTVLLFQKETSRIAAFDMIRGSVPRYWEQPANLSFKPTIKILHPYTNTSECGCGSGRKSGGNASISSSDTTNSSDLAGAGSNNSGSSGSFETSHPGGGSPVLGSSNPNMGAGTSSNLAANTNANAAASEFYLHFHLLTQLFPHISRYVIVDTLSTSKLERPLAENFYAAFCRLREEESSTFSCTKESEQQQQQQALGRGDSSSLHCPSDRLAFTCHSKFNTSTAATSMTSDAKTVFVDYIKFNVKKKMKQHDYNGMLRDLAQQMRHVEEPFSGSGSGVGTSTATEEDGEGPLNFSLYKVARSQGEDGRPTCVLRVLRQQETLARVNCLDCLDRTNLIQSVCARMLYEEMVRSVVDGGSAQAKRASVAVDDRPLRYMFAQQGYAISYLYSNYTFHFENYLLYGKKNSRMDMAKGGVIALCRYAYQNFTDGRKQDAISLLTHQHSPFSVFYYFDIETPFSRDFGSMNTQVVIGIVVGCIPFFYSLWSILLSPHKLYYVPDDDAGRGGVGYNDPGRKRIAASPTLWANNRMAMNKVHLTFVVLWIMYFFFIFQKMKRYRCTFTNRPLLSYNTHNT